MKCRFDGGNPSFGWYPPPIERGGRSHPWWLPPKAGVTTGSSPYLSGVCSGVVVGGNLILENNYLSKKQVIIRGIGHKKGYFQ